MPIRYGTCKHCGSQTESGIRGRVPAVCEKCRYIPKTTHCQTCKVKLEKPGKKRCLECQQEKSRWDRLKRHGLTKQAARQMMEDQGHCCAICREPIEFGRLHVDHDHTHCPGECGCSECVRGFLCPPCNLMIGQARDSIERLRLGADYLEKSSVR